MTPLSKKQFLPDLTAPSVQLESLLNLSRDAIAVVSLDGHILYWNDGAARKFGYSAIDALGQHYGFLLSPFAREPYEAAHRRAVRDGHWEGELTGVSKQGERIAVLSRWQVELDPQGRAQRILISNTDIRLWDRLVATASSRRMPSFDALFAQHPDGVAAFDHAGRVQAINPALSGMIGYPVSELESISLSSVIDFRDVEPLHAAFDQARSGTPQTCELTCIRRDGSCLEASITLLPNVFSNRVVGVYAYIKDISERKENERHILYLANHDALTGLPNRNLLHDRMQHAIEQARRLDSMVAVLFMDLNRFKVINDSLGHDKGDELLRVVAERLKGVLRDGDTVARIGGDEFVVMLENIRHRAEVKQVAALLLDAVCEPLMLNQHEVSVSTSIGASLFPQDGHDAVSLLKHADLAMYTAKESGAGEFRFYEAAMNERALMRLSRENSLREAIAAGHLVLHYQPRLDLESNSIVAVEALVRWNHPEKGLIYPAHFISLAEETGMIDELGDWALRSACRQMAQWRAGGWHAAKVSVNVSALQLRSEHVCSMVAQALAESGLQPHCLELEITESSLMENLDAVLHTLQTFQKMGISLSIDDFGTGYSSLSYLKRLPINTLKIDKSFVRDLSHDEDDATIVSATIAMAHKMQLRVVAEGVTLAEQLHLLTMLRCDEIQGYMLCQPLPAEEVEFFMRTFTPRGLVHGWTQ